MTVLISERVSTPFPSMSKKSRLEPYPKSVLHTPWRGHRQPAEFVRYHTKSQYRTWHRGAVGG